MKNAIMILMLAATVAGANPAGFFAGYVGSRRLAAESTVDPVWDGLVAYYGLDGNAYDEVSGETGTWGADVVETNAVPFAAAGTAASLNRATNAFVTTTFIPTGDSPFGFGNHTVSWWCYRRANHDAAGYVIARSPTPNLFHGMYQRFSPSRTILSTAVSNPDRSEVLSHFSDTPNVVPSLNEWVHMAWTFETRNAGTNNLSNERVATAYFDGVRVFGSTQTTLTARSIYNYAVFLIGYDSSADIRKTDGIFDEVAIHNRALSSNEVYRIYNAQLIYRKP
jgi:hypothetical protein